MQIQLITKKTSHSSSWTLLKQTNQKMVTHIFKRINQPFNQVQEFIFSKIKKMSHPLSKCAFFLFKRRRC
jgi:hypothetical protein